MTDEGWYRVRRIPTTDTDGNPISLFVGQVVHADRLETAVRIDSGPKALVPLEQVVGEYLKAIRETSEETWKRNEEGRS